MKRLIDRLLRRNTSFSERESANLGARVKELLSDRKDYKAFVGLPVSSPDRWAEVKGASETGLILSDGTEIAFSYVTTAIVAYPNGQVVLQELGPLDYPQGITGLEPAKITDSGVIQMEDLREGQNYVKVTYGTSQLEPKSRNHYSTALTNISDKKIRVLRFGAYVKTSRGYELYNATGAFYSAEEFRNWYGLDTSEWIMPGQAVKDPNNYGGLPVIWAYHCVTEDGKEILVGGLLE